MNSLVSLWVVTAERTRAGVADALISTGTLTLVVLLTFDLGWVDVDWVDAIGVEAFLADDAWVETGEDWDVSAAAGFELVGIVAEVVDDFLTLTVS